MEGLIEPNIHPLLVHFAIALTTAAAVAYVLAGMPATNRWRATLVPAADWMLAFAVLSIIATIGAGFQAYYSVAHDAPSHSAMTTHRNWAVPTGIAILLLALWRWRRRAVAPSVLFITGTVVAVALLTVTAWWGGRLVYGYGLGVAQLPQVEGEGHAHEHGADVQSTPTSPRASESPSTVALDTPEGVVDAFAAALRAGDEAVLRRLMSPDVVIAESGGVERSLEEYAGHHMPADMAFSAAVRFTPEQRDVIRSEDAATIISRAQVHGQFQGRTVHSRMIETMVLTRIDGEWRIVHIHWSSAPIADEHEH